MRIRVINPNTTASMTETIAAAFATAQRIAAGLGLTIGEGGTRGPRRGFA